MSSKQDSQEEIEETVQAGGDPWKQNGQSLNVKDLGARPKQKKDKTKDQQERRESSQKEAFPGVVENAWEHVILNIFAEQDASPHVIDSSDFLQCIEIQYAVGKQISQEVIQRLNRRNIQFTVKADVLPAVVEFKCRGSNKLSIEDILKSFRDEILTMLDTCLVPLGSQEGLCILEELKTEVPKVIKDSKAAVYYIASCKSLLIIGEKKPFRELMKKLGVKADFVPELPKRGHTLAETIEVSLHEFMCLIYLDFKHHAVKKFKGLTVEYSQGDIQYFVILKGTVCPGETEVRNFLKRIKKSPIILPNTLCYQLMFHENRGHPNEILNEFIKGILQRKHKRKVDFYIDVAESGNYYVYCLDDFQASLVADILKDNIVYSSGQLHCDESWALAETLSKKGKLRYVRKSDNYFEMCYTNDLLQMITNQLQKDAAAGEVMKLPLPKMILDFLKSYGCYILKDIEQHFDVQVKSIEESFIVLKGEKQRLKEARSDLKEKIKSLRMSVPVYVSEKEMHSRYSDLNEEIRKSHCCWMLQHSQQIEQRLLNCEYLASWMDPVGELKLNIVKGFPCLINTELQIVLTNHCLFPLESKTPPMPAWEDFLTIASKKQMSVGRHFEVAECVDIFYLKKSGLASKRAAAIVVMSDAKTERVIIDKQTLQKQIGLLLKDAEQCHIRTVGINSYILDNLLKSEDIVECIIRAVTEHSLSREQRFVQECFICCDDNYETPLTITDEYFRKKKGYGKALYSKDLQHMKEKEPNMRVKVKFASLDEIKADVLINTTSKDLELDVGNVSKKILEKAGPLIQDECKQKYPNGISFWDVAVTSSYGMKDFGNVKYVFHVAVPKYNYCGFKQGLVTLVKKCLFQAERIGCSSVAFPALGVGKLKYPRRETAAAMFDAVSEFCTEAVSPKLKKIKMVVYPGDQKTCDAFENEEWRRSKKFQKEVPGFARIENFSAAPDAVRAKVGNVSVVTAAETSEKFPSFAVHIFFKTDQDGVILKSSSKEPKSWNDHIYLCGVRTVQDMQNSLKNFGSFFLEERLTEVVFHTNTGDSCKFSQAEQVITIIDWLKQQKCGYFLRKVTVLVTDVAALRSANIEVGNDRSDQIDQEKVQHSGLTVELVGKSKESLETAKKSILCITEKIKEETKGTNLNKDISNDGNRSMKESDFSTRKPDNASSKQDQVELNKGILKMKESKMVKAEINPGIIKLKDLQGILKSWVSHIQQRFEIRIQSINAGAVYVEGSFNSILEFENYLENEFTNELEVLKDDSITLQESDTLILNEDYFSEGKTEVLYIQMTSSEYQILTQLQAYQSLCAGEKCSRVSFDQNNNCLKIACFVGYSKSLEKDVEQFLAELRKDRNMLVDKESCSFTLTDILISVRNGSIKDENVDCCIVPAPPRFKSGYYGLLREVAKTGGEQFIQACDSSGKNTMEDGECRLVYAENLHFTKKVILVKVPWMPDASFENALLRCLRIADETGSASVAFPLLAFNKVPITTCANWYVNALGRFKDDTKSLKRIVFVDKMSNYIEGLQITFEKHFQRVCTEFSQSATPDCTSLHVLPNAGMKIEETDVNIYVAMGELSKFSVDALLCLVDEKFKNKEEYFQNIQFTASNHYRENLSFEQRKRHSVGDVKEISCSGGKLLSKFIIHAVLPIATQLTTTEIGKIVERIFDVATGCSVRSFAIPVTKFECSIAQELNLMVMENTIKICKQKKTNTVKTVYFVTTDSECQMSALTQIQKLIKRCSPV